MASAGAPRSRHEAFLPSVFSKVVPTIVSDMHGRTTGLEEPVPITVIGKISRDLESYDKKILTLECNRECITP